MTDAANGHETDFTMEATPLKYGPGAAEEVGWEVKRLGVKRVLLVSDAWVVSAGITARIRDLIEAETGSEASPLREKSIASVGSPVWNTFRGHRFSSHSPTRQPKRAYR